MSSLEFSESRQNPKRGMVTSDTPHLTRDISSDVVVKKEVFVITSG